MVIWTSDAEKWIWKQRSVLIEAAVRVGLMGFPIVSKGDVICVDGWERK